MRYVVRCEECGEPIGFSYQQGEEEGDGDYADMNEEWCGVEGKTLCYSCYDGQ